MSLTNAGLSSSDKSVCLGKRSNILKLNVIPFPVKYFCNNHLEKTEGYQENMFGKKQNQRLKAKSLLIHQPLICCLIKTKRQSLMCYKTGKRGKYEGHKIANIV